jgi:hypothetical protein
MKDSKKKDFKIEDLCYEFYEAMQVETRNKERQRAMAGKAQLCNG